MWPRRSGCSCTTRSERSTRGRSTASTASAPRPAIFVSWCYARAGSTAFSAGARYAYVPHILWDAQRGENQLSITRRPLPGDLPVFDLDGDGVADHVAMFDDWTGQPGTTFC